MQVNAPYPATPYLVGYLNRAGIDAVQMDLSVELIGAIFSADFLKRTFAMWDNAAEYSNDTNLQRIYALRSSYVSTVDSVVSFLRGGDQSLANLICMPDFLPQGARFENCADLDENFGALGAVDCAKYLSTIYLQDLSDFMRAVVSDHFEIVRYAEKIAVSLPDFDVLDTELAKPMNIIEQKMVELLRTRIELERPDFVGFTVPFPGNLLSALRSAQYIKAEFAEIKTIMGGGYPTTELRLMSNKTIFNYFDYIVLDDGELALKNIIENGELIKTYTADGYVDGDTSAKITHSERGCPDFSGLPHHKYMSLCEVTNPMHRLWSDGRWNKMILAHGCYWAKCAFCDTSLDYIKCYDGLSAEVFVDYMVAVSKQTGSHGFHFVDEAAPPKLLKEISLEILRRGLRFSWWTNIRFEASFTGDLCNLMAEAGCIAVSGGLETANDRLLSLINKGVTVEQATITMRNFYYSGIMVHTYLMFGLPTQTLQDSVDALEVVRQMFRAELINSAFWHRYAMTLHSPSGENPEAFGVRRKSKNINSFANNEIYFAEDRGYNINIVGDALRTSLANYLIGEGIDRPAHKWFECKAQPTTIENSLITDQLIKPDNSRIFNEHARLVWIGGAVVRTDEGIMVYANASTKEIKFADADADFLVEIVGTCSDLNRKITFADAREQYQKYSTEPFVILYHSKKWDMLRGFGLLQL